MWYQAPDVVELQSSEVGYLRSIQTEFAWVCIPQRFQDTPQTLKNAGFEHLSTMNNHHWAHPKYSSILCFYWKRMHDKAAPVPRQRYVWMADGNYKGLSHPWLSGSACGFGFQDGETEEVRPDLRYFNLIRMPLEKLGRGEILRLHLHNYRQIGVGERASFWINGWKPEEYDIEKEKAFHASGGLTFAHFKIEEAPALASSVAGLGAGSGVGVLPKADPIANYRKRRVLLRDQRGRFSVEPRGEQREPRG